MPTKNYNRSNRSRGSDYYPYRENDRRRNYESQSWGNRRNNNYGYDRSNPDYYSRYQDNRNRNDYHAERNIDSYERDRSNYNNRYSDDDVYAHDYDYGRNGNGYSGNSYRNDPYHESRNYSSRYDHRSDDHQNNRSYPDFDNRRDYRYEDDRRERDFSGRAGDRIRDHRNDRNERNDHSYDHDWNNYYNSKRTWYENHPGRAADDRRRFRRKHSLYHDDDYQKNYSKNSGYSRRRNYSDNWSNAYIPTSEYL